jgi:hypothetical protein
VGRRGGDRAPGPRVGRIVAGGVVVVALVAAGVLARMGDDSTPVAVAPALPVPTPTPSPTPGCSTTTVAFVPTSVSIPGVQAHINVIALKRDSHDVPGTPPLTSTGKTEMAFDLGSGIEPGDALGNALLNAHTWPDGSALGNRLLAGLHEGDQFDVQGPLGHICYKVTDRIEVPATDPGKQYYAKAGVPQVAIIVCSGKRLGPGVWTMRTMWFASPVF